MHAPHMTRLPSEREELLEEGLAEVFECLEKGIQSEKEIQAVLDQKIQPGILKDLGEDVGVRDGQVTLSEKGAALAECVVRRKRLAERLLKDVLNVKDEIIDAVACQWEHTLSKEVENSICTLLGHPTESPHGEVIPAGDCCRSESKSVCPVVYALNQLPIGSRARISYLLMKKNPDLRRLLSMGLAPGAVVQIVQRYPTYVIQVGETQLAFDETIAAAVFVCPLAG